MKTKVRVGELRVGDEVYITPTEKRKIESITPDMKQAVCTGGCAIQEKSDGFMSNGNYGYLLRENGIAPKFIVTYDKRGCGDPTELFADYETVTQRVNELANQLDVVQDSIRIYQISRMQVVSITKIVNITS